MTEPLQIYHPRERALVRLADLALTPLRWRSRPGPTAVRRVLLLRLERIGDLLMVLDAIADARRAWPEAQIDLAVGAWNADLARLIPGISDVHIVSVPWLARNETGDSWSALLARARTWRSRGYDVVINFEPDIRSNLLAWRTGAPARIGYSSGGGAAFLTDAEPYVPGAHVSVNAREVVARAAHRGAAPVTPGSSGLQVPDAARAEARARFAGRRRPLIGVHASGGRESKQWHLDRFAEVARQLAASTQGTIVLTGSEADRALVTRVASQLAGVALIDLCGALDLLPLAAVLAELDLLVTGDTGPMHLASAVGTPLVALFGPSDPARYGPRGSTATVLRVSLPCSPCGQVRLPPERCRGHVPDCMDGITVAGVVRAALDLLHAGTTHSGEVASS